MKKIFFILLLLLIHNTKSSFLPFYVTCPSKEKHFRDYLDTKYEIIPTPQFSFTASLLISGLVGFNTDKLSSSRQAVGMSFVLVPAATIRYQTWDVGDIHGGTWDQGIGLSFGISERHAKATFTGALIGFGVGVLVKQAINYNNSKKN